MNTVKNYAVVIAAICIAVFVIDGCKKNNNSSAVISGDYLIVGSAGGFIAGSNTTFYLINNGQLWSDSTVNSGNPPANPANFHFNTLHAAAGYDSVRNLLQQIPGELLGRNGQSIGGIFPDAGYLDVLTSVGGIPYHWNFQTDQSQSSLAVQAFVDSLRRVK